MGHENREYEGLKYVWPRIFLYTVLADINITTSHQGKNHKAIHPQLSKPMDKREDSNEQGHIYDC